MRISAPLLTLAGTVAGTAAAVVAYQSGASVGTTPTQPAADKTDTSTASTTTWLPCEDGWKLVGEACVKVQEKVVVVPDLPAQAAAPAHSAGVRSSSAGSSSRDDDADEANEDGDHAAPGDDDEFENEADDDSGDDGEHAGEDESGHEDVGDDD